MKCMKTRVFLMVTAVTAGIFLASCEKDEDKDTRKPVISNLIVGHNDTIHAGEGIHLEFGVSDNDQLAHYSIEIHAEEEHVHKSALEHVHWDFDSTFTEVSGLKNKTVHHHEILVPEKAEPGEYHFHLSVADISGNLAEQEKELIVAEEDGGEHHHEH